MGQARGVNGLWGRTGGVNGGWEGLWGRAGGYWDGRTDLGGLCVGAPGVELEGLRGVVGKGWGALGRWDGAGRLWGD